MTSLATFIQASAHNLTGIADSSVQAIITSPPYYGLRKYEGAQDVDWPAVTYAPMAGLPPLTVPAMRSPLGNEPTLEAFIGHLVLCLREWRRVLRDDGIAFVNLGDSYAAYRDGKYNPQTVSNGKQRDMPMSGAPTRNGPLLKAQGIKHKDLMMVPARFALAAQADGWWLRSDIIGAKVAPMPESVTDRPTRSHEHIFMLTKAARYFWDADGVREPNVTESNYRNKATEKHNGAVLTPIGAGEREWNNPAGRNMRDVIEWRPSGFSGAHFATWPEAIPEKLIRAATRPNDVVLDPFSGSGTTAKVAVRLGRRALGVDIASEYLNEITAQRFGAGVQMELVQP